MSDATQPSALPKGVGAPATNALALAGYKELSQLAGVSAKELLKLHGVGPKAIRVIQAALEEQGLSLRDQVIDLASRRTKEEAWAVVESGLAAEDSPGSSLEGILADRDHDRR